LSWAARFASRPYLVHPHTPSSGFRSGTYPGKSSTTTPGCSASHALTALARLWIWFRSQTTVTPPSPRSTSPSKPPTPGPRAPAAPARGPGVRHTARRPRPPPVPGVEHRPLAPRGQGAADGRGEEEAGLVHERQVRRPLPRLPDDPGELVTDPPRHLLVVPL